MDSNIVWQNTKISKEKRESLLKQKGMVLWFTGFSGCGKSTVAIALEERLNKIGKLTYLLDGDNVRHGLNKDLDFTQSGRRENLRRIGEVSKLFLDCGVIVLACFISPLKSDREIVREIVGEDFKQVFISCPLEICENRDPKGLYKKARKGEIPNFTGISAPYEEPEDYSLKVNTNELTVEEAVDKVMKFIEKEQGK